MGVGQTLRLFIEDEGAIAPIRDLLRREGAALPAEPPSENACADAYVYTVRYAEWTVRADDCSLPEDLAPLLDRLQDILARFD